MPVQWWATSGFVVDAGGRWFWVTTDHTFHGDRYDTVGLDVLWREFARVETRFWSLGDQSNEGVLVHFDQEAIVSMPEFGKKVGNLPDMEPARSDLLSSLDVALFELVPYYRENFKACGVRPLTAEDVYREYDADFTDAVMSAADQERLAFFITGAPESGLKTSREAALNSILVKTLPIWPKDQTGLRIICTTMWTPRVHEGSVKGMSGGPAYAVLDDRPYWFGVLEAELRAGEEHCVIIAPSAFMYRVIEDLARKLESQAEMSS
jgi:hypothetical protein